MNKFKAILDDKPVMVIKITENPDRYFLRAIFVDAKGFIDSINVAALTDCDVWGNIART